MPAAGGNSSGTGVRAPKYRKADRPAGHSCVRMTRRAHQRQPGREHQLLQERELSHDTLWRLVGYGVLDLEDCHRIDSVSTQLPAGLPFSRAQQYARDHAAREATDTAVTVLGPSPRSWG
ncbi:hypothetical protein [Streptomyces sp. AC550_RSS872]|uniref:hypothetical protein n=1 Tax=Streptomyces sp. AC550_RSS872 TaxID=2823689 RepID=UPI001C27E9D1|nr:hypothetical protein [Streptomyces sp. AC550_RSS872]